MNTTIGITASIVLTAALTAFAVSMLVGPPALSYASSLILSFAYVVLAASLAAEAGPDRRAAGFSGVAFAAMYSGLITTVYFVQLTTVAHATSSPDILKALSYNELGSLMFNLDLLGYGFMSLSTLFAGLSMRPSGVADKVLRVLLVVHGVFAPVCILLPVLDVFGSMPRDSGNNIGILVLIGWCVYFAPVAILAIVHFASRRPDLQVAVEGLVDLRVQAFTSPPA